MEFLVHITITLPPGIPSDERQALYAAESARAASLATAGRLVRLWRIPGRTANWGLWHANDATELHDVLTSLPMWPYMDIEVTPLAEHPNDPQATSLGVERLQDRRRRTGLSRGQGG